MFRDTVRLTRNATGTRVGQTTRWRPSIRQKKRETSPDPNHLKRVLADVFCDPRATVDGIHLSRLGDQRIAEFVWGLIGGAMGGPTSRPTT